MNERDALASDVVYLANACQAHVDLLNMVHFGKAPPDRRRKKKGVTMAQFRAFSRQHNEAFARRRK